jgi:hypothetical protein
MFDLEKYVQNLAKILNETYSDEFLSRTEGFESFKDVQSM